MIQSLREIQIDGLPLFRRGKVRDTYDLGDSLLMVASDRISAFDVVLPTPIPLKGAVLTQLSRYWFDRTRTLCPNHLITADIAEFPSDLRQFDDRLAGRAMIVKKAERIDVECVMRGYLAGSGWAEYQRTGTVCGVPLPPGLVEAARLPEPIFTPALKNDAGHDENVSMAEVERRIGVELAHQLEASSRRIYTAAAEVALRRGIILADSKFEFGFVNGELTLIDELLTPDSSRFWDTKTYSPGRAQPSFDKQFVRDWLVRSGWNKEPPGPELPADVVAGTARRYHEAFKRLTGAPLRAYDSEQTAGRR
ncbi:MAG TPA: phosphoribosylaminoimidazolesuccinocarboxamide synthase [Thermomicrobiales bacterium]|nr:phosphoribosylaminoimidazolesuccinocarboxamide synthase [Thermomicrobiales bacterium]